jgi:hypothetical protein
VKMRDGGRPGRRGGIPHCAIERDQIGGEGGLSSRQGSERDF